MDMSHPLNSPKIQLCSVVTIQKSDSCHIRTTQYLRESRGGSSFQFFLSDFKRKNSATAQIGTTTKAGRIQNSPLLNQL
jgi:hypothetical protein